MELGARYSDGLFEGSPRYLRDCIIALYPDQEGTDFDRKLSSEDPMSIGKLTNLLSDFSNINGGLRLIRTRIKSSKIPDY